MTVPRSLTSRLVLTTVVLVLAVSVLVGAATTLAMRSYLTDQLDRQVKQVLRLAPGAGPGTEVGTIRVVVPDGGEPRGDVVRPGTRTELPDAAAADLASVPPDGSTHSVSVHDLGDYRVLAVAGQGGTIVVGLPESDVSATLTRLMSLELLLALLAVAVAGGAALVVVRRQLRPLREVAATAHRVAALPMATGEIDIEERVPDHLTDDRTEVGQVGAALNTLLAHVRTSRPRWPPGTAASSRCGSSSRTPRTSCARRWPRSPATPSWPGAGRTTQPPWTRPSTRSSRSPPG